MPKSAQQLVAEARSRIENLSVEQTAAEVAGGTVLVDLREADERLEHGVIPGAIHAPRGMLEFYADPGEPKHRGELEPGRRVVLHCSLGARSALAADRLREMGYTDVAHLDGGFTAWSDAGRPVDDAPEAG